MTKAIITGIRAVVFDLDDTLYPERDFAYGGFNAVADWLRKRIDCPNDPAIKMRHLFETGDRRRIFDNLLADLNCDKPDEMIPAMIHVYRTHSPTIRLYEDAEKLLRRLSDRFKLGLISDGPADVQQRKIDVLGLNHRLNEIILTDQWGRSFWKPHLRAFQEMERKFGYSGKYCVYIADNPEKDFQAPHELGWQSVWIRRSDGIYAHITPKIGYEPDHQIGCLDDIDLTL